MYEWKQEAQKWLTVTNGDGNRQAFPIERIACIVGKEKHAVVLLDGGTRIEVKDQTVDGLVALICGDRSS